MPDMKTTTITVVSSLELHQFFDALINLNLKIESFKFTQDGEFMQFELSGNTDNVTLYERFLKGLEYL